MDDVRFDHLSRALAARVPRRGALAGLLAGLSLAAGEAVGSTARRRGRGSTAATRRDAGGNAVIAHCCRDQFGPGRERGQCVADGARGAGPCAHAPGGSCNSLRAYCGDLAGPCCDGLVCRNPPISRCQYFCETTAECIQRFGDDKLVCAHEFQECGDRKCCY